jgi:hypothetical protein
VDHAFPALASARKSLIVGVSWSAADPDDGAMTFLAPLEADGVTIAGLSLRGVCYQREPDRAVTLQLEAAMPRLRTRVPLARLDWRPLNGGHRNPRRGMPSHAGRFLQGTHMHPFDLNWVAANEAMRGGNLPFARSVADDPPTFEEALDMAGIEFRINDIRLIEVPLWSARLL